jgi:hypothetical protein
VLFSRKGNTQIILGAHSASHKEKLEQVFSIRKAISFPCYDPQSFEGDLQLLQVIIFGGFFSNNYFGFFISAYYLYKKVAL